MSDSSLIGMRRTAQRVGGAVKKILEGKKEVTASQITKALEKELKVLAKKG